jgi:hypothetical protein
MTNVFKTLYDESVESKLDYVGDLAAMAFAAQEVIRMIEMDRLDGVQGQNRVAVLKDELAKYYKGKGSNSVFGSSYREAV